MSQNFKIIPAEQLPLEQRVSQLTQFLAANVHLTTSEHDLEKAAQFQQHLDTVQELWETSSSNLERKTFYDPRDSVGNYGRE